MKTLDVLTRFSEWLDQEGLVIGDGMTPADWDNARKVPGEDRRSHEQLAKDFIDFEAGRLEGTASGSAELDYRAELEDKVERQKGLLNGAWSLVSYVGGGDWTGQSAAWQELAEKWRNELFPGDQAPALANLVESGEDAARRFAAQLQRLGAGLHAMDIPLRDGAVEGAEVETALAYLQEQREFIASFQEANAARDLEVSSVLHMLSKEQDDHRTLRDKYRESLHEHTVRDAEDARLRARLAEAYSVLAGTFPPVSDTEMSRVMYEAVTDPDNVTNEDWQALTVDEKNHWMAVAKKVRARVSGGADPADYAVLSRSYGEALGQLLQLDRWLRTNLPAMKHNEASTVDRAILVLSLAQTTVNFLTTTFRAVLPAINTTMNMLGYEWRDGAWSEAKEKTVSPLSPSQG